jgi:HPt (histidine-containing phosphotransfer) domain-containing protein
VEKIVGCGEQLAALNRALALERLGGDQELLKEIAGLFLEDYGHLLAEIRRAVAARDAAALHRAAHTLKGSVSNFGADATSQAAYRLEILGRGGDLSEAEKALEQLEEALGRLTPALMELHSQAL